MSTKKKYDFVDGGFRFRIVYEDYGYCRAKSLRYKYNWQNWQRALNYKANNEHDFCYAEYDCTGSTQLTIDVKRKGRYMFVYFCWSKDV